MKNFTKKLVLMLTISVLFTSCASILNGKYQKVKVHTPSADSKVYVNDELQGTGKTVITKMKRDVSVKQIKIEREGYKPAYVIHYQNRKSALHILSWVPFGILFYPPFLDYGPKSFNYPKEVSGGKDMMEIHKRAENEKYVYLKNTAFDVKKEDIKFTAIKHKNQKKKNDKYKKKTNSEEDIKFDNSIFSEAVSEVLKKNNYSDTTNTIFKSNTNSLNISAKVKKLQIDNVYSVSAKNLMQFLISKLEIEWEMYDVYGQSKYKHTFKSESGEFAIDFKGRDFAMKSSMEDAISSSFYAFMDSNEVQKFIKQQEAKEVKFESLKLVKPALVTSIEDAMDATVTIKVKEGHGSGCFVSTDGYIVTNFHVVAASDKITVITKDGKEYPAKIIRQNEYSDLALIKIEATSKYAFTLPADKNYKIGEDIFAIGTPKSVELGQSLTKGIISGFRTFEKNNMIQTDASVNGGNSGGALVNKSGTFLGVVNAKVYGLGVEGLGFSIPAETIAKDLNIGY
ncbi:S1C family serine protease [Flavobacterium psychrotrophum]|uniref:S1C family serine protease n=1 Tax=Flavobacterium psychrotrophum TaxID=2294119 RepID=UPI000E31C861|nr:trypsin-like peptidase domain-containing protein [Flavobacterium psychrotrophum]